MLLGFGVKISGSNISKPIKIDQKGWKGIKGLGGNK
jgi:hypothetical protein